MAGQALYYPYLSIQDAGWLKAACLYWENGVSRIAPVRSLTRWEESSEDIVLAAEAELVGMHSPWDVLVQAERQFLANESLTGSPGFMRLLERPSEDLARSLQGDDFVLVEKMTGSLRQYLRERGIGHETPSGMFVMPRPYVLIYMTILANLISKSSRMPLVADDKTLDTVGLAFKSIGAEIDAPTDRFTILGQVSIRFPSPAMMRRVPMRDVIAFNRQHNASIRRFRRFAESRMKKIMVAPPDRLKSRIESFERDLADAVRDYKSLWKDLGVAVGLGVLDLHVPAGVEFMADFVHQPALHALVRGVGYVAGLASTGLQARKIYAKVQNSPASYVLAMNRRFGQFHRN